MIVKVNAINIEVDNLIDAATIRNLIKPNADIVIVNGYQAEDNTPISENDEIVLIKRGETPTSEELEYTLSARHTPNIHKKFKAATVAIAGLGGLGSNAAVSLARMGVGKIKLVDFDIVELSNLNRQYYNITQIGQKKTDALSDTIKNINPLVNIETATALVDETNIKELFHGYNIVLECFDTAATKVMFIKTSLQVLPNAFIIGASGVAGLYSTELFKVRKLGKRCIIVGDFENEARQGLGLMASRVAVAANMQANLAARYITGDLNG